MNTSTKEVCDCGRVPYLKWPGGKRWLSPLLADVIWSELAGRYYEPFVGAGAVFVRMRPPIASLSDINAELIEFLQVAAEWPNEVTEAVWRFSNTRDCYDRVRSSIPRTPVGRAARFLYLNRTCWGGVHRLNKNGEFNVPFGNSGRRIISRSHVLEIANAFSTAELAAEDFGVSFGKAGAGDAIYADPPYARKTDSDAFVRYNKKNFTWSDQVRLALCAKQARRRGVFVALSGHFDPEFLSLYQGWWVLRVERHSAISRNTLHRKVAVEAVVFSRRPKNLPQVKDIAFDRIRE